MNKLQWMSTDGSVIDEAQEMANNAHISYEDINLVLQRNSFADVSPCFPRSRSLPSRGAPLPCTTMECTIR